MTADPSHVLLITGSRSWDDEEAMRQAFHRVWLGWGPDRISAPVLISGAASRGADSMAERLWAAAGFDVIAMPADWDAHSRAAGFIRNVQMVQHALTFRARGARVSAAAFLDLCPNPTCSRIDEQQLMPVSPGHFSHGTAHCRAEAIRASIPVLDVYGHRTLPF